MKAPTTFNHGLTDGFHPWKDVAPGRMPLNLPLTFSQLFDVVSLVHSLARFGAWGSRVWVRQWGLCTYHLSLS